MKHVLIAMSLAFAPHAALADDGEMDRGLSMLEEGVGLMLQGLLSEIEPRLSQLEEAIDELNAYHPPEILPNGDILIRRRTPNEPPAPEPGEEIEL